MALGPPEGVSLLINIIAFGKGDGRRPRFAPDGPENP